ncbi:MAG: hypothetical protein B6D61_04520 [Bacteroidetes bacterium 4484_249]|nr:MAG: hypothetical protein B6D61_04520 [Bacteroidetes bacterium 4484_249]
MKKFYILIVSILISIIAISQVAPDKYRVKFTDKNNSPYSINSPEEFLSQKAIDRRNQQDIPVVENDLPVNPQYIEAVAGTGVTILNASKWFNSVTIYTTDQNALNTINDFSFVLSVEKSGGMDNLIRKGKSEKPFFANEYFEEKSENNLKSLSAGNSYDYGAGYNQIHMLNGDVMHDMGYNGTGVTIAVLDAGFQNADNLIVFDSLWENEQILGYKDFVNPQNPNIFNSHYHGSMVLSTMGGNWPGQLVGTAPKADYWLLRSEDADTEYLIEELNWVSAAEFADSVGADIINSSLGYTVFDDPSQDHTYQDMDGNTTPISIGADIAVSKGLIVVNSAGNSGGSPWQYIGAPADGDSVFSIGAVDDNGNYVYFSSTGPTADGRLKPNVVAQGSGSAIVDPGNGNITFGSGTSFSSPITAGMVACLWQANPLKRNMEILESVEQSASLANNPNNELGYGIPDYVVAHSLLTDSGDKLELKDKIEVYPNPFVDEINILIDKNEYTVNSFELIDYTGKVVVYREINKKAYHSQELEIGGLHNLSSGFYFIKITSENEVYIKKVMKK